jgi:hypothetical protein
VWVTLTMGCELEDTNDLRELVTRVKKLEHKVDLLSSIADYEKHPFIFTCLEADMDTNQVDATLALITKAENSLRTENCITYGQFGNELCKIVPAQKHNPEFVTCILNALHDEDKFSGLYEFFKTQLS